MISCLLQTIFFGMNCTINSGVNGVLKVFIGDGAKIRQEIKSISSDTGLKLEYTSDVEYTVNHLYGIFYKPSIIYFLYTDDSITDVDKFYSLATSTDSIIILVADSLDKRSKLYKKVKKEVKEFKAVKELDNRDKIYKDLKLVYTIDDSEFISALYSIYYDFQSANFRYKQVAGETINMVLTGKISSKLAKKYFIMGVC